MSGGTVVEVVVLAFPVVVEAVVEVLVAAGSVLVVVPLGTEVVVDEARELVDGDRVVVLAPGGDVVSGAVPVESLEPPDPPDSKPNGRPTAKLIMATVAASAPAICFVFQPEMSDLIIFPAAHIRIGHGHRDNMDMAHTSEDRAHEHRLRVQPDPAAIPPGSLDSSDVVWVAAATASLKV